MRTVFITGASSGIGAACAEVLASEKKIPSFTLCQKAIQANRVTGTYTSAEPGL